MVTKLALIKDGTVENVILAGEDYTPADRQEEYEHVMGLLEYHLGRPNA